jgi:hypothetical protein
MKSIVSYFQTLILRIKSLHKYSEADIKGTFGFLVDNIYVAFKDQVFQQYVGIPIGHLLCSFIGRLIFIFIWNRIIFRNCYSYYYHLWCYVPLKNFSLITVTGYPSYTQTQTNPKQSKLCPSATHIGISMMSYRSTVADLEGGRGPGSPPPSFCPKFTI